MKHQCIKACFLVRHHIVCHNHLMSVRKYPINIEGTARVFASMLPVDKIDSMFGGSSAPKQVFMYAWFDKDNGASAHVAAPFDGDGGRFKLQMFIHDGINPSLKLHASVRTRDQESNNIRTFTLAVSSSKLEHLLSGCEDSFSMQDQFMPGNFVQVSLRIVNAEDFRNHPSSASNTSKPLIRMGVSALDKIEASNQIMQRISNELQKSIKQNQMVMAPGVADFQQGLTRWNAPPLPLPVLFLSLMLGTPAYVFSLNDASQPGVRGEDILDRSRECAECHQQQGPGVQQPSCGEGYTDAPVPLCRNAHPGGVPAARAPYPPGALPYPSETSTFRGDGRILAQEKRCRIWNPFRAVSAIHVRPWLGSIPEGWCGSRCLADRGDGGSSAQPGPWHPS